MSEKPIENYIKTYRRRSLLSQEELAFLLGAEFGTKVSRYERGRRVPSLETALALEAILGVPVRKIFPGTFRKVDLSVRERVRVLRERLKNDPEKSRLLEKLAALESNPQYD